MDRPAVSADSRIMTRSAPRARWLLLAVLLALASTLVPALFPSGSVMSRPHGSAFDPTTGTVTLRVRQDKPAIEAPAIPLDRADAGAGKAALPAQPPLARDAQSVAYPAGQAWPAAAPPAPPGLWAPTRARAPPSRT